jgi:hypothetical protein
VGEGNSDLSSPDVVPSQPSLTPSSLFLSSVQLQRTSSLFHTITVPEQLPPTSAGLVGPLDLEFVMEYSGGASASLDADVPIVRGRQLQVSVGVSELTIRAHCKMSVRLCENTVGGGGAATSPSGPSSSPAAPPLGQSPIPSVGSTSPQTSQQQQQQQQSGTSDGEAFVAEVFLQALSEPAFSFELRTTASKFGIHNFFGFSVVVKYLLLKWIRTKLMRGLRFEVPLPAEWSRGHPHRVLEQRLFTNPARSNSAHHMTTGRHHTNSSAGSHSSVFETVLTAPTVAHSGASPLSLQLGKTVSSLHATGTAGNTDTV